MATGSVGDPAMSRFWREAEIWDVGLSWERFRVRHAHVAGLDWWDLAEVRLRLALLRNGVVDYFPLPCARIPRAAK